MEKPVLAMVLLVLIVGLVAGACGSSDPTATPRPAATPVPTNTPTVEATQPPAGDGAATGEVVNITLTEHPFSFQPDGIDLKVGTTYALTFNAPHEFHSFTVDDLDLDISINAGDPVVFEFTPTQAGTFDLICVPHEFLGMVGEVRVS